MRFLDELKTFWRTYVFILTPIVLLPLPLLIPGKEAACGYGVLIMAVYWLTEALPIAVTALLPMVLFPLLGVLGAKDVAINYMKDTNFVFMGGLIMAVSVEHSNLHTRIALNVLKVMGSRPRWLLLGFMLPTWFLSMWISNTATTAMMIPVAEAVLQQLKIGMLAQRDEEEEKNQTGDGKGYGSLDPAASEKVLEVEMTSFGKEAVTKMSTIQVDGETPFKLSHQDSQKSTDKQPCIKENEDHIEQKASYICKMLCLSVCYAANVGGTATLTGTGPNIVLAELATSIYLEHGMKSPVTWATWVPFGLPNAMILLVFGWVWLQLFFLGPRDFCCCCGGETHNPENDKRVKEVVLKEHSKLGPMKFSEYANLIAFSILVLLWFFRDPGFISGYDSFFPAGYVTDSTPAMLMAVLLFVIPDNKPQSALCCSSGPEGPQRREALLNWRLVSTRLPWGPIFVLGGGFALADACTKSGLSTVIAEAMEEMSSLPPWVMVLVVTTLVAMLTEITSNVATTTLVLPILAALAEGIGVNPLYLMLPATLAASLAFMLPVATPPNAIVFSYGHLRVIDMAKAGLMMNILGILVVTMGVHSWGAALYDLDTVPWGNTTAI